MARRATTVTHTRIQDVARALFATRGFDATSLQEIAAALDVTKAALYYHFPPKLLHTILDTVVDGYFPVAEAFQDRVDDLEAALFARQPLKAIVATCAPGSPILSSRPAPRRAAAPATHGCRPPR